MSKQFLHLEKKIISVILIDYYLWVNFVLQIKAFNYYWDSKNHEREQVHVLSYERT